MKKLYLLIFFASMAFLLAGCPPKETPAPDPPPPEPPCEGAECPCEGMECDDADPPPCDEDPNRDERAECKVEDEKDDPPDPPPPPPPGPLPCDEDPNRDERAECKVEDKEDDPPKGDGLAFVERNEAQAVEEPEPVQKGDGLAFVKRNKAQAIEQKKEEELIIEEKDADESVQPPKAEEIMILPPEESDAAFSEMGMVYFAYDKSEITADFEEVIQKNYEWIYQNPDVQIQLEGHCDERGTNEYNLALGERRAKAVFDYLVGLGANPSQFTIVSFGEERPAVYGSNESSWRQNRRVEFTRL